MLYKYIHSVTYEIADYALISIDFSTTRQMKEEEEEEVYTIFLRSDIEPWTDQ